MFDLDVYKAFLPEPACEAEIRRAVVAAGGRCGRVLVETHRTAAYGAVRGRWLEVLDAERAGERVFLGDAP